VWFDDMRLYPSRCVPSLSSITDLNQDCSVDGKDLRILAGDYLMHDYTVTAEEPDAAGLLASYQFEGNYEDSSGNGNNGTPVGAGITIEDDPVRGQVLSLPGGDNVFVDCNGVGISGNVPRTIACWAKADNTSIPDWTLIFGMPAVAAETALTSISAALAGPAVSALTSGAGNVRYSPITKLSSGDIMPCHTMDTRYGTTEMGR
jgi:hypothetical protein